MVLNVKSGIENLKGDRKYIKVLKKITVNQGDKFNSIEPFDKMKIERKKLIISKAEKFINKNTYEN